MERRRAPSTRMGARYAIGYIKGLVDVNVRMLTVTLLSKLSSAPLLRPNKSSSNVRRYFTSEQFTLDFPDIVENEVALNLAPARNTC